MTDIKRANKANAPASAKTHRVRCAIYTRKSTDEGLEQAFNTLDAQRESAEDFIRSHRHEGWEAIPARYDDGGHSGADMNRSAIPNAAGEFAA